MHVVVNGEPMSLAGAVVTANYFDVLGLTPPAGRFFAAEEDRHPGTHPVAVIGYALWKARLGGTSDARRHDGHGGIP